MSKNIELGKAHAVRILVARDLGLNPIFEILGEMYIKGELHPIQYGNLEKGGIDAVEKIQKANKVKEALIIQEKYI